MKRQRRAASFSCFCLLLTVASHATTVSTNPTLPYIVTLRAEVDVDGLIRKVNVKPTLVYRHAFSGFAAAMDRTAIAKLKEDGRVVAVERDGYVEFCGQTNGAGIRRMGLTNFPIARINGADERIDVDVAVIDTGIQLDHPDLNVVQHVGFAGSGLNGEDWEGHGTHVAGIIGAIDNDFGIVGVAPGVRLWSVQVIGPTNSGAWSDALAGMEYVAEHAAEIEVANCSFIGASQSPVVAVQQAIRNLVERGVVVVAGVGNSRVNIIGRDRIWGTEDDILPAALPEVMAVSAMDPEANLIAEFSGYSSKGRASNVVLSSGGTIDVAAPGVGILSTFKLASYSIRQGTSMATAHVSGLVALYVAANGRGQNLNDVYRIRQAIVDAALPQARWAGGFDHFAEDPDAHKEPLAMFSEIWIPAPRIFAQGPSSSGFQLSFTTVPGYRYTVQHLHSFSSTNQWSDLVATNATTSAATVLDPTSGSTRYYRIARQPAP